jgi:hypothetical protein
MFAMIYVLHDTTKIIINISAKAVSITAVTNAPQIPQMDLVLFVVTQPILGRLIL